MGALTASYSRSSIKILTNVQHQLGKKKQFSAPIGVTLGLCCSKTRGKNT